MMRRQLQGAEVLGNGSPERMFCARVRLPCGPLYQPGRPGGCTPLELSRLSSLAGPVVTLNCWTFAFRQQKTTSNGYSITRWFLFAPLAVRLPRAFTPAAGEVMLHAIETPLLSNHLSASVGLAQL